MASARQPSQARRDLRLHFAAWVAGALLVVAVLLALPVVAAAQAPPPCPDAPVEYTGTDEVVNELRALRVDHRAACLAVVDRLEANGGKLSGARDDLALLVKDAAALARHDELVTAVEANAPVDGSPEVVAAVEASQLEIDAALWFLAGLCCALFAGGLFAREVLA